MNNIVSFDYNNSYDPSAPFITINVDEHNPSRSPMTISAFVDSGADSTMLPINILQSVGAEYEDSVWLVGTAGGRQKLDSYPVSIYVENEVAHVSIECRAIISIVDLSPDLT